MECPLSQGLLYFIELLSQHPGKDSPHHLIEDSPHSTSDLGEDSSQHSLATVNLTESLLPGEASPHPTPHPSEASPQHSLAATVNLLCALLHEHITTAEANLVKASMMAPMYGVVQSIRAVLEMRDTASNVGEIWGPVFGRLVELCRHLSELVSPVVCSSSPEGFLPEGDEGSGVAAKAHSLEAFGMTGDTLSKGGGESETLAVHGSSAESGESDLTDVVHSSSVGAGGPEVASEIHSSSVGSAVSGAPTMVHNSSTGGRDEVDHISSVVDGVPAVHSSVAATGSAQSLLLCCWHTMKEVSLLLGHLVEHSRIAVGAGVTKELLTHQQVPNVTVELLGCPGPVFIYRGTRFFRCDLDFHRNRISYTTSKKYIIIILCTGRQ